jgi:hypothetical protein
LGVEGNGNGDSNCNGKRFNTEKGGERLEDTEREGCRLESGQEE